MIGWIVAGFGWLLFLFAYRALKPRTAALKVIAYKDTGILDARDARAYQRLAQQVLYDTALVYDAPEGDEYEH